LCLGGRTDFQSGDAHKLYHSIKRILSFSDDTLLFVGHDYRGLNLTTVAEERHYNPRIGGEVSENDFVGFMRNLNLPHPKVWKVRGKCF
jgi:sulfur dioxygenase